MRLTVLITAVLLSHWGYGNAQAARALRPGLLPGCALPALDQMTGSVPFQIEMVLKLRATGVVDNVQIQKSSGSHELDEAFRAAALQCRYVAVRGDAAKYDLRQDLRFDLASNRLPLAGAERCFPVPYPTMARKLGEQGTAGISFRILGTDAPEVVVKRSTGSERLDNHAVDMVTSCLSNESVRSELAQGEWYSQAVTFRIED